MYQLQSTMALVSLAVGSEGVQAGFVILVLICFNFRSFDANWRVWADAHGEE